MKLLDIFMILYYIEKLYKVSEAQNQYKSLTCGEDNSPITVVYEGIARIETYPWLGMLYYPLHKKRLTTAVLLITRQIVIGAATEIDRLPKNDFRARARVVLGHNCSGPRIGVRDYSFHPDYGQNTYSALAMIQLETDNLVQELRPICQPPTYFIKPQFYAMTLANDCNNAIVKIHKMQYVSDQECKQYYRRSQLDIDSLWPTHTTCARAISGGECVWRSGAALVVKVGGRWRLLGFGVYGPGCRAPARFMDYGMYSQWVRRSVERIGRPAISRMGPDHVILRRTLSSVQRFGACDVEETKAEIFTDTTQILRTGQEFLVKYNLSLYANVEYSCVVFRAEKVDEVGKDGLKTDTYKKPKLSLRRWCAGPNALCHDFQFIEIHFYVEIQFRNSITYKVSAYGKEAKAIDSERATAYGNELHQTPPIAKYTDVTKSLVNLQKTRNFFWFYKQDYK